MDAAGERAASIETATDDMRQRRISYSRVVSLSHPLAPGIPQWPGDPPVAVEEWAAIARDGYRLRRFSMGDHSGTHMTCPASFYPDGATTDAYPPEQLIRPAVVIDVRERCRNNPDYALTEGDLREWETRHGPIPPGALALLCTGWAQYWDNAARYLGRYPGMDGAGGLRFPGFGLDAARLLVEERGIGGAGTDTAGLEPGADTAFSVSRMLLAQPRLALQNLTNLELLPPTGAITLIAPLPLRGSPAAPVSVTALIP